MHDHPVLESVLFRLRPDDPARFRDADDAAQSFLAAAPGYLGRTLAVDDEGTYLDLVRWADRASALAAGDAFLASSAGRAMAELVDPGSVVLRHLGIARDAAALAA